jgi:hypothetical protein
MVNEREIISSIVIDEFSEYVKIAQKANSKPYEKDKCRIPNKYLTEEFGWFRKGKKNVLVRIADGLVLTSNPGIAGKPRYKKVNGQDIYNGNVSRQSRATLVKNIHIYLHDFISAIDSIENIDLFPLTLEVIFYVYDQGKYNIDNDNKWIWTKCIQDTLVECQKIIDDNPHIINRNESETILIPEDQQQKLIINIYGKKNSNN